MKYRTAALLAAAAVAAVAAGSRVGTGAEGMRMGSWPEARMEGWTARFLSVRRVMADLRWLDILQYTGESGYYLDGGRALAELAGRASDLDPHFIRPYAFAGSLLYWQCKRPEDAVELLRKGIAANPGEDRLKLYLAAFTYTSMDKLKDRLGYLEELADDADAPPIVRRILAHAYAKAGDFRRAAAVARFVLATTADPAERRWAESALRRYSGRGGTGAK